MNKQQRVRTSGDRRDDDQGPPSGWKDRRHSPERRIPAVEETDMSEAEWHRYFGPLESGLATAPAAHSIAADSIDKARS